MVTTVIQFNVSAKADSKLCALDTAKRMLRVIGISANSDCLLKRKRDIRSLVKSYLEKEERMRDEATFKATMLNLLDEDIRSVDENIWTVKRGRYCCSPECDSFMARLGHPTTDVLRCAK